MALYHFLYLTLDSWRSRNEQFKIVIAIRAVLALTLAIAAPVATSRSKQPDYMK